MTLQMKTFLEMWSSGCAFDELVKYKLNGVINMETTLDFCMELRQLCDNATSQITLNKQLDEQILQSLKQALTKAKGA